jgi:hypothetical protein
MKAQGMKGLGFDRTIIEVLYQYRKDNPGMDLSQHPAIVEYDRLMAAGAKPEDTVKCASDKVCLRCGLWGVKGGVASHKKSCKGVIEPRNLFSDIQKERQEFHRQQLQLLGIPTIVPTGSEGEGSAMRTEELFARAPEQAVASPSVNNSTTDSIRVIISRSAMAAFANSTSVNAGEPDQTAAGSSVSNITRSTYRISQAYWIHYIILQNTNNAPGPSVPTKSTDKRKGTTRLSPVRILPRTSIRHQSDNIGRMLEDVGSTLGAHWEHVRSMLGTCGFPLVRYGINRYANIGMDQ